MNGIDLDSIAEYNKENNIEPESILKSVSDIMEGARNIPGKKFIEEAQELIEARKFFMPALNQRNAVEGVTGYQFPHDFRNFSVCKCHQYELR